MTTIILTYRNRELSILNKCLNSLNSQTNQEFEVVLVNYGSFKDFEIELNSLAEDFDFLNIIHCNTQYELWCKSRAINIALNQTKTPYVFIGDIDMLFHPEFMDRLEKLKKDFDTTYFQVGFLSQEESALNKRFKEFTINFKSTEGATGMTFFKTEDLLSINGYDEFYNGWGSEDTDVHVRLKNKGIKVKFYCDEILLLHQWHPKQYRTKDSLEPFHSHLEQINLEYLKFNESEKTIDSNLKFDYGVYCNDDYEKLNDPDKEYLLTNQTAQIKAFINGVLLSNSNLVIKLKIVQDNNYMSIKQLAKGVLGKKTISFLDLDDLNNLLLETIIFNLRNCPYRYKFNQQTKTINLTIKL